MVEAMVQCKESYRSKALIKALGHVLLWVLVKNITKKGCKVHEKFIQVEKTVFVVNLCGLCTWLNVNW